MSKNRPKIWLSPDMYVYRSDYNIVKFILTRKKHESVTDLQILENCKKHSHYLKIDGVEYSDKPIGFVQNYNDDIPTYVEGNILRVDYDFGTSPRRIIIRTVKNEVVNINLEHDIMITRKDDTDEEKQD